MKAIFIIMLIACFGFSSKGQDKDIESIIKQMDQKNAAVIVKADSVAMVDLLAADFTINRSTGNVVSGLANTLALFKTGTVGYDSFSVHTDFVLVKNPTLAISMGSEVVILGGRSELKGQTVRRRFTHVWTKEKNSWRLLARHANNLCNP